MLKEVTNSKLTFRLNTDQQFRYVFILDDRSYFKSIEAKYNPAMDLVLTFDMGLKLVIEKFGGRVAYVDHLIDQNTMQKENFTIYDFFTLWHYDQKQKDLFCYQGLDFGFMFRQEIWNDFTFSLRLWLCLGYLDQIEFQELSVGTVHKSLLIILEVKKLKYSTIEKNKDWKGGSYFFPVFQWMENAITPNGIRAYIRSFVLFAFPRFIIILEKLKLLKVNPLVFVQKYHPTNRIIQRLIAEGKTTVAIEGFSNDKKLQSLLIGRQIPFKKMKRHYYTEAERIIAHFQKNKNYRLVLKENEDVSDFIYNIILSKIKSRIPSYLNTLDSVNSYFSKRDLKLEVMISNIGILNGAVDTYCKKHNIPSYMIINGILCNDYLDEAKYASFINSYSETIKTYYFRNMKNVFVLGDPRMDSYSHMSKKVINRKAPTITIGTSGFNNIDLNSYMSVEFEFLYEVLTALENKKQTIPELKIILKVRPNGYQHQYKNFVAEYFPKMEMEIFDRVPMVSVLERTDLYISIYSQTLFEASVIGIPSIYYKKDVEFMDPPFDGKSELVTIYSIKELEDAIDDFTVDHPRFHDFLKFNIMEKYIGPVDGKNLDRNMNFINRLINEKADKVTA
jgi:hypothetical protein